MIRTFAAALVVTASMLVAAPAVPASAAPGDPHPDCTEAYDWMAQLTAQVDTLHATMAGQAAAIAQKDIALAEAARTVARKDATIKRLRAKIRLLTEAPPSPQG